MEHKVKERYAPGVESYEGVIPVWLIVVYVGLLAWGAYYLVAYWGGGPASGG
ncbi:MAG: hypothetical protein ACYC7J_14435 [Syntrophales bacterium]